MRRGNVLTGLSSCPDPTALPPLPRVPFSRRVPGATFPGGLERTLAPVFRYGVSGDHEEKEKLCSVSSEKEKTRVTRGLLLL